MVDLLIPPSCNWFQHNGLATRSADKIFITSCFKNIVVYRIKDERGPPKVIQFLSHRSGKVNGIALYPDHSHPEYGNSLGIIGDCGTVSLVNILNGTYITQYQFQKTNNFVSLCWAVVNEDDVIAIVGNGGKLIVWQPKYLVATSYTISQKNLSIIEALPQDKSKALIASEKLILLVSLKNGDILNQLKGHDQLVYCLRLYPGNVNPLSMDDLKTNTRWKLDSSDDETSNKKNNSSEAKSGGGPYFVTSDLGRNIFLWDLSLERYILKFNVPTSTNFSNKMQKDRNCKHHITLNWMDNKLISSTIMGEVLQWNLEQSGSKYKLLHHHHTRVIYNMEILNNILITSSQDRSIEGYDVHSRKSHFRLQTMGGCANVMAFCPQDAHRLAFGLQDSAINIITFSGNQPTKSQSIYQNVKEKVLSLSWHPSHEGTLLFGTSVGQVGTVDVSSTKVNTFSYYHKKPTYKVEWAPPLNPSITGLDLPWYVYSFGDREISIRNPTNYMADPINIDSILKFKSKENENFYPSEFSFTPDYEYLAVGSLDGIIKIYERKTAELKAQIPCVRKTILHLVWKPPLSDADTPYILAVASAETNVYLFDLEKIFKTGESVCSVTQPLRELSAHSARVVWLSWSPHQDGILASASYDHTVQIWNSNTGEPICNYGGHDHRVFRVEFSPLDADCLYSFAEENCIHQWRPSKISLRTPKESLEYAKKAKPKLVSEQLLNDTKSESNGSKLESDSVADITSSCASIKKSSNKSFFPVFHTVALRKRTFHQLCILSLNEVIKAQKHSISINGAKQDLGDELFDEELDCKSVDKSNSTEEKGATNSPELCIEETLKKYGMLLSKEQEIPKVKDILHYISFFGNISDLDQVISSEIANHKSKENLLNANMMHCWQGSLESHIKWAARHKQLDAFLVSLAPQVSHSLWEFACEAYSVQLLESGQPAMAATYLLSIRKDEEAVDMLLRQKLFKEALTLAKYRVCFSQELINKVVDSWTSVAVFEGNFELAAALQLSIGKIESSARLMARRLESSSLIVAAQLYEASKQPDLAYSTMVLALKESSLKHEFDKIYFLIEQMPQLTWYKVVTICHECFLNHVEKYYRNDGSPLSPFPSEFKQLCSSDSGNMYPILNVVEQWNKCGIVPSNYSDYLGQIQEHFLTQKMPTTLKQLWFSVSNCVTKMLLEYVNEDTSNFVICNYLNEIIKLIKFWGKNNQMYYITHAFLSNGIDDVTTLAIPFVSESSLLNIRYEYIASEMIELLKHLNDNDSYCPWAEIAPINGHEVDKSNGTSSKTSESGIPDTQDVIENNSQSLETLNGHVKPESLTSNIKKIEIFYSSYEDFVNSIETFVKFLNLIFEAKYSNTEEDRDVQTPSLINNESVIRNQDIKKCVSDIIVLLGQRASINESQLLELITKINSIPN